MTTIQAVQYVNEHIVMIASAARLNNPAALEVVSAYGQYVREPNIVTGELLINAALDWVDYQKANAGADL
jgi:hypothetical protein